MTRRRIMVLLRSSCREGPLVKVTAGPSYVRLSEARVKARATQADAEIGARALGLETVAVGRARSRGAGTFMVAPASRIDLEPRPHRGEEAALLVGKVGAGRDGQLDDTIVPVLRQR